MVLYFEIKFLDFLYSSPDIMSKGDSHTSMLVYVFYQSVYTEYNYMQKNMRSVLVLSCYHA